MASFSLTDAFILVNTVNMSGFFRKVILHTTAAELANTPFGNFWITRIAGIKDWDLQIEFNQDFANAATDQLLWPLFGTVVPLEIRPTSGARSVTNPAYLGSFLLSDYTPLEGSVGDLAGSSVTWKGAIALTRATS